LTHVSTNTGRRESAAHADRLVAADASPLIGLAAALAFDLLRELFGTLVVSRAVVDEVTADESRPGAAELTAAMRAGWIRVAPTPMSTWELSELGVGEASTLALTAEHRGPKLVLMDDVLGRERAAAMDIETVDLAGLLLAAKRARLVGDVRPLLERLARKGFMIPTPRLRVLLEG
jgi:predicted nucleic acid-binding protein